MGRGPYRAAILDFDGTIADTRAGIVIAMEAALARHGVASPGEAAIASLIGLPLRVVFERLAQGASAERVAELGASYSAAYPAIARDHERLYEGVAETLDALAAHGVGLAIATSKSLRGATRATDALGIARHFGIIVAADSVANPKPHPESVERALAHLGVDPRAALVVGDTTYDMEMGRRAGADTCAVTWGVHSRAALEAERPTHVAESWAAVRRLFE